MRVLAGPEIKTSVGPFAETVPRGELAAIDVLLLALGVGGRHGVLLRDVRIAEARLRFTNRSPVCVKAVLTVEYFSSKSVQCFSSLSQLSGPPQLQLRLPLRTDEPLADYFHVGSGTHLLTKV